MNQDHAIAGVGGVSTTAMLATVLQTFQHVDTATATSEAGLIVLALGALAALLTPMLGRPPAKLDPVKERPAVPAAVLIAPAPVPAPPAA